jgi:hypothetical protein
MTIAIKTDHVYPPIPIRCYDWSAYVYGEEESGPYGWGYTEDEAIADLKDKLPETANIVVRKVNRNYP